MYSFNTSSLMTVTNDQTTAANALDMINVVPNPYYAWDEYEESVYENKIKITDSQIDQLMSLTRQLEKLDTNQLKQKVEEFQSTARKLAGAKDKVSKFAASFGDFLQSVGSFFSGLFGGSDKG